VWHLGAERRVYNPGDTTVSQTQRALTYCYLSQRNTPRIAIQNEKSTHWGLILRPLPRHANTLLWPHGQIPPPKSTSCKYTIHRVNVHKTSFFNQTAPICSCAKLCTFTIHNNLHARHLIINYHKNIHCIHNGKKYKLINLVRCVTQRNELQSHKAQLQLLLHLLTSLI
jgi:hypothetical protein